MSFPPAPGWGDRLEAIVEKNGGVSAVARGSSVADSTIKRYFKADNEPGAYKLAAIARFCGVSVEQILYGDETAGRVQAYAGLTTYVDGPKLEDDTAALLAEVVFIPLLEVIASAGPGIENSNPVAKDYLPFPRRWLEQLNLPAEAARFLDSRGDSMTETIKEDAICLADIRWQKPRLDAIFVVVHNNDVRIKRIGRGMEGRVTLISDNPRYETEVLSEPEARSLKIAGRVVWAGGKI